MVTAGKKQAVQHLLGPLGSIGTVLQKAKGLTTWQVVMLAMVGYFAWHLCLSAVTWPVRAAERAMNRMTPTQQEAPVAAPAAVPQKFTVATMTSVRLLRALNRSS